MLLDSAMVDVVIWTPGILAAGVEGTFKMIFSMSMASRLSCYTDDMNYGARVRYVGVFPTWTFFIEYTTSPNVSNHGQMPNKCHECNIGHLHTITHVI